MSTDLVMTASADSSLVEDALQPGPQRAEDIQVLRDDRLPLYIHTQGARVGLSRQMLTITPPAGSDGEVRQVGLLGRISQLNLMGAIQISTQAILACLKNEVEIAYFSAVGWFYGRTTPVQNRQVHYRLAQFRAFETPKALEISRVLIADKIANGRTLLRRNTDDGTAVEAQLAELNTFKQRAEAADAPQTLLGFEGSAARIYWQCYDAMVSKDRPALAMKGRTRRPPLDPVNAMLSYGYALLTKDCTLAVAGCGLDPYLGVFHTPHHGRPALALDLMEPFRPIIVDSVVLQMVRRGQVSADDFTHKEDGVQMRAPLRKKLLATYERRMDTLITHPTLGFRMSYRRALAAQARLICKAFCDEIEVLPLFRTR